MAINTEDHKRYRDSILIIIHELAKMEMVYEKLETSHAAQEISSQLSYSGSELMTIVNLIDDMVSGLKFDKDVLKLK